MHKCKCIYCKIEFDRDKIPYTQVSERRYAHKECADKNFVPKAKDEQEYSELVAYIDELFGMEYLNAKIAKQIKDYRTQYKYSYKGMKNALEYWYRIKMAPKNEGIYGIGIVPYIYDEAKKYFEKIEIANIVNADIKEYQHTLYEIVIDAPRSEKRQPRLFNLGDED